MADEYDGATCSCGSTWFRLDPHPANETDVPGAVILDRRGHVRGYTGMPVCVNCDAKWVPPRERLRVVED